MATRKALCDRTKALWGKNIWWNMNSFTPCVLVVVKLDIDWNYVEKKLERKSKKNDLSEEDMTLVKVLWRINQVRVSVNLENYQGIKPWNHQVQVTPTSTTEESRHRVKLITGWPIDWDFAFISNCFIIKILFWNCRGAGNQSFRDSTKDLFRDHTPEIVVLMETKIGIQSMGIFFHQFGLLEAAVSDPVGRTGGIWVMWNPVAVKLQTVHTSNQVIHLIVTKANYEDWLLSAVYANPNHAIRDHVRTNLHMIAQSWNLPWLVGGDFNDHMDSSEKKELLPGLEQ